MTVIATWGGINIDPALLDNRGYLTPITVNGQVYPRLLGYMAAALTQAQNTVFGTPGTAAPSNTIPGGDTLTGSSGSATTYARGDHVHKVNAQYASAAPPILYYATGGYVPGSGLDDYPALSAALTAMSTAGGGAVMLPGGTLLISQGLTIPANCCIIGCGTTIKPTAAMTNMITVTGGRVSLRDVSLFNVSSFAANGIKVDKPYDNYLCDLSDIETTGFTRGIWVIRGDVIRINRHWSQNCTTHLMIDAGFLNSSAQDYYYLNGNGVDLGWPGMPGGQPAGSTQPEGFKFIGGEILPYTNGDFGIRIRAGLEGIIDDVTVDQIKKANAAGIICDSTNWAVRAIKIHNSWTGINAGTTGTGPGVSLVGGASVQIIILNHTFDSHGTYGLVADGYPGVLLDLQVAHCRFASNVTGDMYLNNCRATVIGTQFGHATNTIVTAGTQVTITGIANTFTANPQLGTLTTSRGFYAFNTGNTNDSWDGDNANIGVNVRANALVNKSIDTWAALIADPGTTSNSQLALRALSNPNGINVMLEGNGATLFRKFVRVNSGHLQVMSHDYSRNLLDLDDAGLLAVGSFKVAATDDAGSAWTPLVASPTPGTGAFSNANGVIYTKKVGRTVHFNLTANVVTNSTGAGYVGMPMPYAAAHDSAFGGKDFTTGKALEGQLSASGTTLAMNFTDGTFPGASGAKLVMNGTYEANS